MAKKSIKKPASTTASQVQQVDVDNLLLDPHNPRLVEYLVDSAPSQEDLLKILWQQMAVDELAMSIASSGYFEYEPLFVAREGGKSYVVEGNRRLAAVRLLLDSQLQKKLRATDLPKLTPSVRASLRTLPVIYTTREAVWQYLGFKHVNGPAKWDSFAKAEYIAEVHLGFKVPLEDIARQIGDKHRTVQRLYRALMVIRQAERSGVYHREDRYKGHFSFSHLYTGLDYEGISSFLKLKSESDELRTPVPKNRLPQLGELCRWLYGDRSLDERPKVESQNPHLRQLDEVLKSQEATDSLRAGLPLSVALEVSYGDERVFEKALITAKEQLQKARGTLSTGYSGQRDLLKLGSDIFELALDLVEEMERKGTAPRARRRQQP